MNYLFTGNSMKHNQPDFITPLRNLTVEVGRNATFECFVTGIKKFRVSPFTLFIPQFLNTYIEDFSKKIRAMLEEAGYKREKESWLGIEFKAIR